VSDGFKHSILEDAVGEPTIKDFRAEVERITGIEFQGAKPRDLIWTDWKQLVAYLQATGDEVQRVELSDDEIEQALSAVSDGGEFEIPVDGSTKKLVLTSGEGGTH